MSDFAQKLRAASPSQIPCVIVRDPKTGRIKLNGYYFCMPDIATCFSGEAKKREFVVYYEQGCDWGLKNRGPLFYEIRPPFKAEVINGEEDLK